MLADDLIANVGSPEDRLYCGAFADLARRIRGAQRFDLSPEMMLSAFTVTHSTPIGSQLRALSLCKFPFRSTWFEWPGGFAGIESARTDCQAPVPKRMGALVDTDESLQRGSITWAWIHPHMGINICPLAITFDWRAEPEPLADIARNATWHERASEADWKKLAVDFPRIRNSTRQDVIADNMRFGIILNPGMQAFMDRASQVSAFGKLMNAAVKDIEGEAPLLRASIMLLNSRNLAEHRPRAISPKLNKSRARTGKPPLLDYTHVAIKLSRALGARAGMAADARQPSRLHLVRGHFKIRASGVYWWSPFARGAATGRPIERQQRTVSI
jgi:hypothetical protein